MYSTTYEARLARTLAAVSMDPVDKIPFSYNGPAYLAREMGLTMGEYVHDFPKSTDAAVEFCRRHPGIDSIHSPIMEPRALSTLWLAPAKVPGEELPEDELWQVEEQEIVTFEDYEAILREGYGPWSERVMTERLNAPHKKMAPYISYLPETIRKLKDSGVPVLNQGSCGSPFEHLCGGRTLTQFFMDILDEPELVKAVLDKAMEFEQAQFAAQLENTHPLGAWVGGWRAAPQMMGHDMWLEFAWPYIKKMVEIAVEHDVLPVLHFDSCWDRELETLKELPARKCMLMLDGTTDIRKARSILGDHMCIMGDVPAQLLAFGSENEVYEYVTKLIDDVGPKTGFIVSSGCDAPLNAKPENISAMIQATEDYRTK